MTAVEALKESGASIRAHIPGTAGALWVKPGPKFIGAIYHPLDNGGFDRVARDANAIAHVEAKRAGEECGGECWICAVFRNAGEPV